MIAVSRCYTCANIVQWCKDVCPILMDLALPQTAKSIVTQIAASPGMHTCTDSTASKHALPHLKYSRPGALASFRGHRAFQMHSSGSSRMSARCMHARCKYQQSGMWKASHIFNPSQPEASPGTMPSSFSLTHKRGQVWRGSRLPAGAVVRH